MLIINFFEENKSNVKKTWEGIRNIINISKKDCIIPTHLLYKKQIINGKEEVAESFNEFFVNIGNAVEEKSLREKHCLATTLMSEILKKCFWTLLMNPK